MDKARPQSLFVVLSFGDLAPYFSSIVLLEKSAKNLENAAHLTSSEGRPKIKRSSSFPALDTHQNEKEYASHLTSEGLPEIKSRLFTCSLDLQKDYVAHFTLKPGYPVVFRWTFCASAISEDLCVVPDCGSPYFPIDAQLKGCLWNLRTKSCKSFDTPKDCSYYEHVVSVGGFFYFLTYGFHKPGSLFKRYDPVGGWETLDPLPGDEDGFGGQVSASAVFGDTIVLKLECKFWAYNVGRERWYPVSVVGQDGEECNNILGEAVVIENTIYALADNKSRRGLVLALSIEKKVTNDDDLEFSCSLLSKIVVPGMEKNRIEKEDSMCKSRHLVHLGEDKFCLVESCQSFFFYDYQPIQVTYIKLIKEDGEKLRMKITYTFIYKLKIPRQQQFRVMLCFSLPDDDKTAALKQGKGPVLEFNPFPEDYVSEEQKVKNQEAEDRSVYVRNVPGNANVIQVVEKELEKFGAIKKDGIQVLKNRKEEYYAFVEFECATSKQRAIEASPIVIGGSSAEIMAKKTSKKIKKNKRKVMNQGSL